MIRLYQRCRRWRVLPKPGGLMEQDEAMMELMDVIQECAEQARIDAANEERMKAAHDENLRRLGVKRA